MSARAHRLTWGAVAAAGLVGVGAMLRLANLHWPPLSDAEAVLALGAAQGTLEGSPFADVMPGALGLSAAYHVATRLAFDMVGAGDGLARLLPALAGCLMVLLPLGLRDRIGRAPALAAMLTLAFSPSMIAASRTVSGLTLAVLGLGGWFLLGLASPSTDTGGRSLVLGGLCAGLGLLAGPAAVSGVLGLAGGLLLARALWGPMALAGASLRSLAPRQIGIALAVGAALAAGFGLYPVGLSGVFDSLGVWIRGWVEPGGLPPLGALAALMVHDPFTLVFGFWGALILLRRGDPLGRLFVSWALGTLVVAMVYPARQAADLAWVCLPLSLLAGVALVDIGQRLVTSWSWSGHALLVAGLLLLAVFGYYQLTGYAMGSSPGVLGSQPGLGVVFLVVVLGLAVLMIALFGVGWSARAAADSAGCALAILLWLSSIATTWELSLGSRAAGAGTLWRGQASTPGMRMLVDTLEQISQAHTGRTDALPIAVGADLPSGAAWALRRFPRSIPLDPNPAPEVYLASAQAVPSGMGAEYLGQVIQTGEHWGWMGILPPLELLSGRDGDLLTLPERWVVLVRTDIATLGAVSEGLPTVP
jgi:hypothetical protein